MNTTEQPRAPAELAAVLAHRRFVERRNPFPYIVAHDVFRSDFYQTLEQEFWTLLHHGYEHHGETERFSRNISGYDAMSLRFLPGYRGALSFFYSREFHDMVAALTGIKATLDVSGGLHHHEPGNRSGWVHNDLNPGWFLDNPEPDGVNLGEPYRCDYQRGICSPGAPTPRETVRSTAVLFYLANEPWEPGDGGETGLFRHRSASSDQPVAVVPPRNNTVLIFRCTPYSYHAFQGNRRKARNSVVLWLHSPKDDIEGRWGPGAIQPWT